MPAASYLLSALGGLSRAQKHYVPEHQLLGVGWGGRSNSEGGGTGFMPTLCGFPGAS